MAGIYTHTLRWVLLLNPGGSFVSSLWERAALKLSPFQTARDKKRETPAGSPGAHRRLNRNKRHIHKKERPPQHTHTHKRMSTHNVPPLVKSTPAPCRLHTDHSERTDTWDSTLFNHKKEWIRKKNINMKQKWIDRPTYRYKIGQNKRYKKDTIQDRTMEI